jgi:hypothetical protein
MGGLVMNDRGTLGGFTRNGSSADADAPPDFDQSNYDDWYYVGDGQKNGPISAVTIRRLLNDRKISASTLVWRRGMKDWSTIRDSDLEAFVESEPPTISPQHIGNGYVWVLATLPLLWGFIDASIAYSNQEAAVRTIVLGFPYQPSRGLPWQLTFLVNGILGWLDDRRLQKAGYGTTWTRVFAVSFFPVYLFVRANRLKQRPSYAIVCIISFVVGMLLLASAGS